MISIQGRFYFMSQLSPSPNYFNFSLSELECIFEKVFFKKKKKSQMNIREALGTGSRKRCRESFFFSSFTAAPSAYPSSQARGLTGAVAAGLCHSQSNSGSEPSLRPTPQLMATQDP